ncbi:coagulation factor IX-like [Anguilla anguilla]|uniref:coagulation factor IX-like n=1 Tax=Anguilla anguilla TaxID=7936 RepID=UPI0015AD6069|nr:coagulation factor IX-like [Anguilla anguilla]
MSPHNGMARIFLLFFICGLLLENWLYCGATLFLPQHAAESVLKRHKRYNTGRLEEVMKDNLERECIEERCDWEEAREVFENREKTMEFWVSYIDGDQCESSPCQNGAKCEDSMSSYLCWCPVGYTGKNCEIETLRQCDVRNGGCMHICHSDVVRGVSCDCAVGYSLDQDGRTCTPEGKFPCGKLGISIVAANSDTRSVYARPPEMGESSNDTIHSPPLLNATAGPSKPTANSTTPSPTSATTATTARPPPGEVPDAAFFPTLPTIVTKENQDHRIVGGNEVIPGEIPWQVALMDKRTLLGFCGGAILSDLWVITAAHCLLEGKVDSIFVRVGEHNVHKKEGTEGDYEIAEKHVHPHYNKAQSQYNHDVALLRLQKPIAFSDFALPVCLGPKEFTEALLRADSKSVVSGWGKVRFEGVESPVLQKVEVPYVDRTQCKGSSNDRITRFMFCAGYATEKRDSCQGDSGGPHTTKQGDTWFLTGIISWGEECAKEGKYGIYTRVSRYYTWISHTTGLKKGTSNEDQEQ